ncbi:hypothetical protein [Dongia sp.]|uniref:hypothetical protein n=1 Tax=Dongia sp. TaxID=1977262 RepID=UPI0035AF5457
MSKTKKTYSLDELHKHFRELKKKEVISGAYRICWYNARGKKARKIRRLMGTDADGVLYIGGSGKSKDGIAARLKVRGQDFQTPNKYPGWFQVLHAPASLRSSTHRPQPSVPSKEIRIEIHKGQDGMNLEAKLLEKYLREFGELPPLNRGWPSELTKIVCEAIDNAAKQRQRKPRTHR